MDKLAVETRAASPTPWTHLLSTIAAFLGKRLIGRPRHGAVTITFPNGKARTFGDPSTGVHARLTLHNFKVLQKTLQRGTVGFAQAYIDGDVEIEDLTALFRYFLQNRDVLDSGENSWYGRAAQDITYHLSRHNSKEGSKKNISEHYDLGNDFYAEWLDETMTYSSGIFAEPDGSLEDAQRRKYERLAARAGVQEGDHVLEIGSGWGGFAVHLAADLGCRVTTVTISKEQHEYVEKLVVEHGLVDRIDARMQDFRTIEGTYDRIVSVEMMESIPKQLWDPFFRQLRTRVRAGGSIGLQLIVVADRHWRESDEYPDFARRYIFPGGQVPAPWVLRELASRHRLDWREDEGFGASYARTLACWLERFDAAWPRIATMGFDERFRRMWRYYLAYCGAGFASGRTDVRQIVLDPA